MPLRSLAELGVAQATPCSSLPESSTSILLKILLSPVLDQHS